MARRIIYNPVDFVDASAPFYENIIGIISDQTDRISRNIELAREERLLEEDRAWQEDQLQLQLDARRESLDKQIDSQEDQNRLNRHQNQMQHLDQMQYNWAKLGLERMTDAQKAADSEVQDAQTRMNEITKTLRETALLPPDAPLRYTVERNPETGELWVFNTETGDGSAKSIGGFNEFLVQRQPLVDFAVQTLNGKSFGNWARETLAEGDTYEDAETGAMVIDRNKAIDIGSEIRSGIYDGPAMEIIRKINAGDAGDQIRLLYNNDRDARVRNPVEVATDVSFVREVLFNTNNFKPLFDPDDENLFRDEVKDEFNQFWPSPVDFTLPNMPTNTIKGQTIGVMQESFMNYRNVVEGRSDEVDKVGKSIDTIVRLGREYLNSNPDNIPEHLRDMPRELLVKSLRVRDDVFMSNTPDLNNMFIYPDTEKEAYDVSTRGAGLYKQREQEKKEHEDYIERVFTPSLPSGVGRFN